MRIGRAAASCRHERFSAAVNVNRLHAREQDDSPVSFAADITVRCADCGEPFGFRCRDMGVAPDRPAVSVDTLELRVPLRPPSELKLAGIT